MNTREITPEEKFRLGKSLNGECDYVMPWEVMDKFLDLGQVVELEKWENLVSAGDMIADVFIAFDGILRCWYVDEDTERTAYFSGLPTIIINYHTYYANLPAFYNIQACTEAKLLRIRRSLFDELIANSHEFARWNLRVSQNQHYYFERKQRLNTGQAIDRYLSLVRALPNVMKRLPLHIVASYLGIKPQYLSRLRGMVHNKSGAGGETIVDPKAEARAARKVSSKKTK
ncbi:MAG: Crp/Fnr family transcriptional regulator [Prevotella sp.]|nr:Crp/Fnr family transcriptional regulator [Prevotella sp.]MCM1075028.1 Crp/Fnr family transcriptional regulator [Ruminococcus sp.]